MMTILSLGIACCALAANLTYVSAGVLAHLGIMPPWRKWWRP